MEKLSLISVFLFGIFLLCLALPKQVQAQIIVIDAGHGYNANGSNGDGRSPTEINTNWSVSIKLRNQIQNNLSWTVHLTRPNNGNGSWVSIDDRWMMSNNWNADRFLSIHCNAGGGTGTETFYCNNNDPTPAPDISFATEVQARMVQYGAWTSRRVVEDFSYLPFHLGVLNFSTATACLNEIGFVDSSDSTKLLDDAWRDNFANAYYVALQNNLGAANPRPDLTITAGTQFVTPTSVAAGSSVTVGCSEDNSGNATAGANVVSLYLSTDAVLTPGSNGDTHLGFIQFSSLAANSNSPVNSKSIQIPSGTAPGTYFLYFWADGEQDVSESNEGNNFASRQLMVTGVTTPTITTSVASLPSFGSVAIGQNSAPQSYTLSGSNLSANITIQAPTGFQISLSSTSGFTNSLTLTRSGGSVPATTIFARFSPQSSGSQTGNISHTSSGATTRNVSVSGTGTGGGCASTSINVGQTLNGSLTSSDCVLSGTSRRYDVYSFQGQAGQGIAASMDSSAFDTYLYLTNSANQVLDEDNNSGPGTNSRIPNASGFFTLPTTGSYFLWTSSASDNATGAYSVSLSGCTYSLSSSENQVGSGNGGGSFQMDAPSGCGWSAVSDSPSWLTTSSSGSGDGTVSYNFTANTSTSPRTGRITVGGQISTITQIGLGGAGNVRFSSATYNANEGGGDVTITVTRTGGTGTGTVQYSTSNGTATAGADYVSASGTLLFAGNETSKSFTITILDDTTFEGNESFGLSLSNNSSSLTLGNPNTATLTIIDNDSAPDSSGPGLSINSHSNGDTVSNSTISLSGTASDSGRGNNGISSVTVNGVGASGGTASGSGTANWSRSLTLSQGANNITVVARDNSSNQNSTNQSITLFYQPVQNYTIAISASPSAGGTVSGSGTFAAGSSRTVTASANSGYSFANWTENGGVVSSSASYTFTLNGNRTLVAIFSIVPSSNAAYDSILKAPKCPVPGSVCDSGTLVNGRGNITGGAEPNQPNTIHNSCADNTIGSYHSDESIDRIRISTLDGSSFAPGKTVKIEVTVWAFSVTDDFLDLFYTGDATNPNWTYITTLAPSISGAQVLSTTFTLPSGGSLQAVRANFLYRGAPTPCSGGSDHYDDHDDLIFAVGSGATQSIQLLLEEFGPSSSQVAALDSTLLLKDPFPVVNEANLFNPGLDRNTRVIIFATNLQLTQGETSSSVVVNLIDSSGASYDIVAEDVRPVPNSNFTQVIFRLPNNLPAGTCTIKVIAHGQSSNTGTIRIRI